MKRFILLLALLFPVSLRAYSINTFVTVPIAEGGYSTAVRYFFSRQSNEPFDLNLHVITPLFAYGITNRLSVFTAFPVVVSDFHAPSGGAIPSSTDFGLGDIPVYLRMDVFRKHWVAQNMAISVLSGLEIPSGDDPLHPLISSHSVDIPLGLIATWQSTGNEVDFDFIYQWNTEGNGIENGDSFRYDLAYTRRLLPWKLPDKGEPGLIWDIILELNGSHVNQSGVVGAPAALPNTGGDLLFILAGFEWIFRDNGIQLGIQTPIVKELNGSQVEPQFNILLNWAWNSVFF